MPRAASPATTSTGSWRCEWLAGRLCGAPRAPSRATRGGGPDPRERAARARSSGPSERGARAPPSCPPVRSRHRPTPRSCTEEEEEQDGEYTRKAAKIARARFADTDTEASLARLHGGPVAGLDSAPMGVKAAAGLLSMCQLLKLATSADVSSATGAGAAAASSSSSSGGGGGMPPSGAPGSYDVGVASLDKYMRLDNAAIRALSLLPSRRDAIPAGGGGSGSAAPSAAASAVTSVFGMFAQHLRTPAGRRTLKSWLLQPLRDAEEIGWRQDRVTAFVESVALRQGWKAWGFDDVTPLLARLARPRAGLGELVKLRQVMDSLPAAVALLQTHGGGGGEGGGDGAAAADADADGGALGAFAGSLQQLVAMCTPWLDEYKRTVDDRDPRRPRLRSAMDEGLSELQERVEACREGIAVLKARYEAAWPSEVVGGGLELLNDRAKGWVFRVKKSAEKALRGISPGVNMVAVLKDGIYFNTPKLVTAAEELGEAEGAYGDRSRELIGPLLASAVAVAPVLESAQVLVGELDVYCAFAEVATSSPNCDWTRPTMNAGGGGGGGAGAAAAAAAGAGDGADDDTAIGDLLVVNGRHPVVNHQEENYIANDYTMRRTAGRFQIITGACVLRLSTKAACCRCCAAPPSPTPLVLALPHWNPFARASHSTPSRVQAPTRAARASTSAPLACWRCWRRSARTCPPTQR